LQNVKHLLSDVNFFLIFFENSFAYFFVLGDVLTTALGWRSYVGITGLFLKVSYVFCRMPLTGWLMQKHRFISTFS